MAVSRKLKKILAERFPPPDKVDLRDDDGIIGVVTSKKFRRMDTMQRQDLIHDILTTHLTDEERRHVLLIVAVTPEEELADAKGKAGGENGDVLRYSFPTNALRR